MKPWFPALWLSVLLLASGVMAAPDAMPPPDSVVEVLVTAQRTDPRLPWRREHPSARQGYGVLVSPTRVITTEELVRNAALVEIRKPGQARKLAARIHQADIRADMAALDIEALPPDALLTPVAFADELQRGDKVQIVTYDEAGQRKAGDGRITETSVEAVPDAASSLLMFRVLTDLKSDGQGAPVFHDGRLAGLAIDYDAESQSSLVIPSLILKRVLEDIDAPPYEGLPTAGLLWAPLVDPAKRRYLALKDESRGILVTRLLPGSGAAQALEPGDVIMSWDGKPIDSQGYYTDETYGRLLMTHLIAGRRRPGDIVPVSIIRGGRPMDVQITLAVHSDRNALVPRNAEELPSDYMVEGGLVLRELTVDYLKAFGGKWMVNANPRLVNMSLTRGMMPERAGQRVVILTAVLPDPINIGYQGIRDEIVTRVNGQAIENLDDVFDIMKRDGVIRRLSFESTSLELVLDPSLIKEANRRLAAQYRIPALSVRHGGGAQR